MGFLRAGETRKFECARYDLRLLPGKPEKCNDDASQGWGSIQSGRVMCSWDRRDGQFVGGVGMSKRKAYGKRGGAMRCDAIFDGRPRERVLSHTLVGIPKHYVLYQRDRQRRWMHTTEKATLAYTHTPTHHRTLVPRLLAKAATRKPTHPSTTALMLL